MDYNSWETRYVLVLWLCILCLIPFDISSMDSTLNSFTTTDNKPGAGDEKSSNLVIEIIRISKNFLSDPGPVRDAASACLSSLLTRPDMDNTVLSSFFMYACSVTKLWTEKGKNATLEVAASSFEVIGVLQTVAQIFKKGERGRLLLNAPTMLAQCVAIASQTNQVKVRKLSIKLIQRIGMTFLPPRVASWRYQRGQRSLSQNLNNTPVSLSNDSNLLLDNTNKNKDENKNRNENPENVHEDEDEDFEVSCEVEEILDQILSNLSDSDTVVRWSAAKGIGRITMRLPKAYANDVVGAVIGTYCNLLYVTVYYTSSSLSFVSVLCCVLCEVSVCAVCCTALWLDFE